MGSSGNICNGNRIQIKGSNVMGFKIMYLQRSTVAMKKECKIFGQGTDYKAEVKKDDGMVVGKRRQLLRADV